MIIEVWDPHRLLWDEPYERARVLELKKQYPEPNHIVIVRKVK